VEVVVERGKGSEFYSFEVAKDPYLSPSLVFWCLYNALLVRGDDLSQQTIRYEIQTIWQCGHEQLSEEVQLKGAVAGPASGMSLAPDWMAPLQILMANRHQAMDLQSVRATLTISRRMETAVITALQAPGHARPGDRLTVGVTLQPRRGEATDLSWEMNLPAHLRPGSYQLLVANARDLFALEAQRAAARFSDLSLPATLELIRAPRSASELVLTLFAPHRGVVVDGRELAGLPGSVKALFQNDRSGHITAALGGIAASARRQSGSVLRGHVIRELVIDPPTQPIRKETRP
jgi:hypothetical protein